MEIIDQAHSNFPEALRVLSGMPKRLYCEGDMAVLRRPCIAVVGSRSMTSYGHQVVRLLVPPLVRAGFTVISGLAYGVDACAHEVTLNERGATVGVLGSGLQQVSPAVHTKLANRIIGSGGCLITEYPPLQTARPYHFPARNRIIAGLADVTLVVEAGEKSGSLITGRLAREYGKELAVVLGDITRTQSLGCYRLLQHGAHAVTSALEIADLLGESTRSRVQLALPTPLTGVAGSVYDCISHGAASVDAIVQQTGLQVSQLQSILTVLELDGYITLKGSQWLTTL